MDFTYLNSISDGDKEFIKQFVSTFQSNTANILKEMEKSFKQRDFVSLGKQAHQLKPSLEMLKLESYDTCLTIQNHPEETTLKQLETLRESCLKAGEAMLKEFNL